MEYNNTEPPKKNRITIRQVAEMAGVTIGTVSHVINGTAPISPETTARVKEVIAWHHRWDAILQTIT